MCATGREGVEMRKTAVQFTNIPTALLRCRRRKKYDGSELTNRLNFHAAKKKTLFETMLAQLGIRNKLIKPYTLRHNGKVERSHRKNNQEFYACHSSFAARRAH